jgi:hypothetical protein
MQWRSIDTFDHVQRGLGAEEREEAEAARGGELRNLSDDMKRMLGALHVSLAWFSLE